LSPEIDEGNFTKAVGYYVRAFPGGPREPAS
jgi:hypothetical protein